MAQQDGGWPLGLMRMRRRSLDFSSSLSFNTLTSCSSTTSSDLDTESTGSLLHERRSITLGSLIGITSVLELSNRRQSSSVEVQKKRCKPSGVVCFSLCSGAADANVGGGDVMSGNAPSLGHYLEVERRACIAHRSWASIAYGRRIFLKDNDG